MAEIRTAPAQRAWTVYAGDRNTALLQFQQPDGSPWDITGATITSQARVEAADPAVALEATCVVVDGPAGVARMEWDGEAVRVLLAGADTWTGVWDLQILEAGQTLPETTLAGKFTALHDVTRTTP